VLDGILVAYLAMPLIDRDDRPNGTLCVMTPAATAERRPRNGFSAILLKSRRKGFSVPDMLSAAECCAISSIGYAMKIAGLLLLYNVRDQGVR